MKNFTDLKKKWNLIKLVLFSFICIGSFGSCMDEGTEIKLPTYSSSDPNKAVVFSDYTPNEGAIRTRMYINGENFGTDVSLINVIIGGQKAKVIHSSGTQIYCMVPARASGGYVEVEIMNADGSRNAKHTFELKFNYIYNSMVSTLCGIVDEEGKSSTEDGTFDKAGFVSPNIMLFDNSKGRRTVFLFEGNNMIRTIDLSGEVVSTVLKTGVVNWRHVNAMDWSMDKDTMFVNNVTGYQNEPGVYYFLRKENFGIPHNCVIEQDINCVFTNPDPTNNGIFMIRGNDASLLRGIFNTETQLWDAVKIASFGNSGQWYQNAVFHPSGDFVYCISRNQHCIQRAIYNRDTKSLESPTVIAGGFGSAGYKDAPGTDARFSTPIQGCFVKNEDYVKEGRKDIYDFYVTDNGNHCIRKITPDGIVSTFAGRGSTSSDGIVYGYIDGDLRKTARFKNPVGICYEESTGTFYISDTGNRRIRMISVQ